MVVSLYLHIWEHTIWKLRANVCGRPLTMFHLLECVWREREGGGDVYDLNRLILCCLSCAAKLAPLAYGIKKLQICCVVEDDKVRKPLPVCVLSVCVLSVCALCVGALWVCALCVCSLCVLSVCALCVCSLCVLSVCALCVYSLCVLSVCALCVCACACSCVCVCALLVCSCVCKRER